MNPKDILRPCLDPSISNINCEKSWVLQDFETGDFYLKTWSPLDQNEYSEWLKNYISSGIYDCEKNPSRCFPYTRLGYTFDWGGSVYKQSNNKHVGVNEFIIRSKKTIKIESVIHINKYCS